jgi:hypothetical protein
MMNETPTPAEVALSAFDKILDAISNFECLGYKDSQRIRLHAMRAALRALAAMEPTWAMADAADYETEPRNIDVTNTCKAYILAAASEGETNP